MYRKSVMAHMSGKRRPPTTQCGSTKPSCRLDTPMVTVSVLASVRGAGAAVVPVPPAVVLAPAAAVLALPDAVVAGAAVVVAFDDLLSPPQAASSAARPAPALPSRIERRDQPPPNPNVPGSTGGMVSSWWKSTGPSSSSIICVPPMAGWRLTPSAQRAAATRSDSPRAWPANVCGQGIYRTFGPGRKPLRGTDSADATVRPSEGGR